MAQQTKMDYVIMRKQNYATEHIDFSRTSPELLEAIFEQILVCEELGKGLSKEEIKTICKFTSEIQIENYLHDRKVA